MLVFVLNKNNIPLMPCSPQKARKLLKENKAKVIRKTPFTIRLKFNSSGYKQPLIAGMDTGSKYVGCAVISDKEVVYQSETKLRQDIKLKMERRKMFRRNRRVRKCRYRKPRFSNRAASRKLGRLAPTIRSKINSHVRERDFVNSILPITEWKVETANFDIHKITNPNVYGISYQNGVQKDFYNVKAYVLDRDNYKCQSKQKVKHSDKLHVHHIVFKSKGGSDEPNNLITLCEDCHKSLHNGDFDIKGKRSKTQHATHVNIIKSQLKKIWSFTETFGYETKYKRELMKLPKTHYNDAIAICCNDDNETFSFANTVYYKRCVSKGDYQLTKGKRSEIKIPVGKLFGLRKHDLIKTTQGTGFIKGKRSSGYFALETINGEKVHNSVNVKKNIVRLSARTTILIQPMEAAILPRSKTLGFFADLT